MLVLMTWYCTVGLLCVHVVLVRTEPAEDPREVQAAGRFRKDLSANAVSKRTLYGST
jgi:hypothetical protein